MKALMAVVALSLALAWSAVARASVPGSGRAPVLHGKDKPDAGDDDEEDRG